MSASASANSKWPDLRLASTLWSLMGSQPDAAEKKESGSTPATITDKDSSKSSKKSGTRLRQHPRESDAGATMVARSHREASQELPPLQNDQQGSDGEDDFGALEMFDSNAPQANQSSQAPEAGATESSSKKHKRDKKDKKRIDKDHEAEAEEQKSSGKHRKRSRKSSHDQGSANGPDHDAEYAITDEPAETPLSPSKKKRKNSDSADGKHRKKRKSHSHSTQGSDDGAGASTFLRRKRDDVGVDTIQEDPAESDREQSPSVARVNRRSQSREARSRENSAPAGNGAPETRQAKGTGEATDVERDVEALAREAWQEHINSQASKRVDAEMTDAPQADGENTAHPEEPTSPKKTRAGRQKKAKPTFFEQPMQDEDVYGLDDLPSPSAMTPKQRNRSKRAAPKQQSKRQRRKAQRAGDQEGDYGEDGPNKRSRTEGYTQGKFSDVELSRIAHAVESFRAENDMPQEQVNEMIQAAGGTAAGEAHAQLWLRIFAECPDRHRQKVINITRKKFHNFVARGTWTLEQDAELSELINMHGAKWSYIAGLINRHPEDIRDRYRNYLVCGSSQKKEAWDESEESRLTSYVLGAMRAIDEIREQQPSRQLLQKTYEELIDWQNISEQMDRTRSRLQCITKWKSMNMRVNSKDKLVSGEPDAQISFRLEKARRQIDDMPEEEKFRLVLAIQGSGAGTDAKIPWQKIVDKQYRNKWHRTTQTLLWHRLRSSVPDWQKKTVRDCASYLMERYNQTSELPSVAGEGFDDDEEMALIATVPVGSRLSQNQEGISSSMVDEADLADDEPQEPQEMQIDPALSEVPRSAKKATPARRTLNGKRPSSGRRPRKPAETNDQEEEAAVAAEVDAQNGDDAEIDESKQRKKKKTPSKPKKGKGKKDAEALSDSDMDDMEDLPSRVAA